MRQPARCGWVRRLRGPFSKNRLRGPFSKIGCEGPSRNRIGCEGHSRKPRPGAERAGLVRSGAADSPGEGAGRGPSAGRCPQRSLFFAVPAVSVAVASFRFPMHEAPILISAAGRAGVAARVHPLRPAPCGTMQTTCNQPAWLAQAGRSVRTGWKAEPLSARAPPPPSSPPPPPSLTRLHPSVRGEQHPRRRRGCSAATARQARPARAGGRAERSERPAHTRTGGVRLRGLPGRAGAGLDSDARGGPCGARPARPRRHESLASAVTDPLHRRPATLPLQPPDLVAGRAPAASVRHDSLRPEDLPRLPGHDSARPVPLAVPAAVEGSALRAAAAGAGAEIGGARAFAGPHLSCVC